jgi:predicted dinucleotide-binding enzyme
MTTISIIGSGNMATAIGTRAAKHGHTIEVMSRDTAKAQALADKIGNGATAGTFGATPLGDIVIVAVPYTNACYDVGEGAPSAHGDRRGAAS